MSRETAIRQTHAAVTLEALEAFANKGLLRRAQKDLERGEAPFFEMSESGLVVAISGQRVTLVEAGPAKATCTCPSPGVCQHILVACLQLMRPPTVHQGSAHDEWLAFTEEDIIAAFGLPTLRTAHELSLAHEAQITHGNVLTVRFASLNAEVLALPGTGIAGIIVNGMSEKRHAQIAAAAMLTVRRAAGMRWDPPANEKDRAAPAHREDVLESAAALLEEIVTAGLARLSPALVERLSALAISAQTAELHRLALLLRRIGTQAGDWLQRKPHADLGQIFNEMATAYALVHAGPHLAGTGRESYIEVGSLDLIGVAAWPWRTPSGYEGLTVLFWDAANSAWNTWSDARPRAFQGGFSAVSRFAQPGPWEGAESPAQLVRSRFRVMNAKRNRWGRLSSSAESKVLVTGTSEVSQLPFIDDWTTLDSLNTTNVGLREHDPRTAYQIIRPAEWERHPFDPVAQSLVWKFRDKNQRALELRLAFDDLAKPAIKHLETLSDDDLHDARLLGRCLRVQGRLQIQPFALIRNGHADSLFFGDAKPACITSSSISIVTTDDEVNDAEPEPAATVHSFIGELSYAAISSLEWLAESGLRARNVDARQRLEELSKQARSLGLIRLEGLFANTTSAASWLRFRWVLSVMQRACGTIRAHAE